jgi:curved DNA-binding protein
MQFKDYYQILGVPPGADADVIKTAYRKLARKFHPDVSKEKNAEERFKDINEAYEVLRDNQKRKAYDNLRARGYRPGEEFRPPPNFEQDFNVDFGEIFGNRGGGGDAGGFSDFFESLFGRARAGGAGRGPGPQPRAQDLRAHIDIDLETAFSGGTTRIALDGKTLDVKIPPGVQPGQQIRLRGQGPHGENILLEIGFKPHATYAIDGRDLIVKLPVAPWEAALGATVEVPTLAGSVELRIPAGSKSGKKLRLKGRGLPGAEAGDQYVIVEIQAPAPETDAQREAYAALQAAFPDFAPRP